MLPEIVAALECPLCGAPLREEDRALRCARRHAFDVARAGYVSFLVGRHDRIGDTRAMLAARARILDAGHFDPLSRALAASAGAAGGGLAVEVGAGTARHLRAVVDARPGTAGLAIDVSPDAARVAARAHPRIAAIAADARVRLPVAAAAARIVLVAFAPRNGPELRRIVRADGALVVATPAPEHLAELQGPLGLVGVDPLKRERLEAALAASFALERSDRVSWSMDLARAECVALAAMGPSAHHADAADLAARALALPERTGVTGACEVDVWRPR